MASPCLAQLATHEALRTFAVKIVMYKSVDVMPEQCSGALHAKKPSPVIPTDVGYGPGGGQEWSRRDMYFLPTVRHATHPWHGSAPARTPLATGLGLGCLGVAEVDDVDDDPTGPAPLSTSCRGVIDEVPNPAAAGDVDLPAAHLTALGAAAPGRTLERMLTVAIVQSRIGLQLIENPLALPRRLVRKFLPVRRHLRVAGHDLPVSRPDRARNRRRAFERLAHARGRTSRTGLSSSRSAVSSAASSGSCTICADAFHRCSSRASGS